MSRMNVEQLRSLRRQKRVEMGMMGANRATTRITVSMGTSGIAVGARETLAALMAELSAQNLTNVAVRQTGGMGLESQEPTVEVRMEGMPTVIYGRVDEELAREIVWVHILKGHLIDDHIADRPAVDIIGGR